MKFVVIIGVFFLILNISIQNKLAGIIIKNYFKTHEEVKKHCMVDINVDKKLETIFEDNGDIDSSENFKCFIKCILIASGGLNEAGDIFIENIAKNLQINIEIIDDAVKKCSEFDKVDLCQGATKLIECGLKYLESHL